MLLVILIVNQSKFLEETEQVVYNSKHSTKSFFLVGDLNQTHYPWSLSDIYNLEFQNT